LRRPLRRTPLRRHSGTSKYAGSCAAYSTARRIGESPASHASSTSASRADDQTMPLPKQITLGEDPTPANLAARRVRRARLSRITLRSRADAVKFKAHLEFALVLCWFRTPSRRRVIGLRFWLEAENHFRNYERRYMLRPPSRMSRVKNPCSRSPHGVWAHSADLSPISPRVLSCVPWTS
jgi:hypothetical protein